MTLLRIMVTRPMILVILIMLIVTLLLGDAAHDSCNATSVGNDYDDSAFDDGMLLMILVTLLIMMLTLLMILLTLTMMMVTPVIIMVTPIMRLVLLAVGDADL